MKQSAVQVVSDLLADMVGWKVPKRVFNLLSISPLPLTSMFPRTEFVL